MNLSLEELKAEEEYLDEVLQIIKNIIKAGDISLSIDMDKIAEMKKYIWENSTELDEIEISSGIYNVNQSVSSTNKQFKKIQSLKKSLITPYFGRIDFNDDSQSQKIYIGINGIIDENNFYVFDWRSPVASLFYNYGIGYASYEAPLGKFEGRILLKRQYKIKNGKIIRVFNSDLNIDDEFLQEILTESSSSMMTNIVSSIQREQNAIIRNETDKYLIVQGIAGSGKTSVALHRIAYLLYQQKSLSSNNVLIFSPNDVFSEYISQVLPELGEENVLQTTYRDFAKAYLKDIKNIETFTGFVERYYNQKYFNEEEYKEIVFKQSDQFINLFNNFINKYIENLSFNKNINIFNKEFSIKDLNYLFHQKYNNKPIYNRLQFIAEYICDFVKVSNKKNEQLIYKELSENLNYSINYLDIYNKFLSSEEYEKEVSSLSNINRKKILFQDLTPLLYLKFELGGYPNSSNIRHIIIDEAQDYNLLQFAILKRIFRNASFTILGDINQTINPYYKYDDLNIINQIFNEEGRFIELLKTYRSTEKIIDYTNKILGLNNICTVRKETAHEVVLNDIDNDDIVEKLEEDLINMRESGIKRIAIITKTKNEARELYNQLKSKISDLSLIEEQVKESLTDTLIMPSYMSKGLEFDGVISYTDKNNTYSEKDKYLFYVICTRAQHSLIIYNPPLLKLEKELHYGK